MQQYYAYTLVLSVLCAVVLTYFLGTLRKKADKAKVSPRRSGGRKLFTVIYLLATGFATQMVDARFDFRRYTLFGAEASVPNTLYPALLFAGVLLLYACAFHFYSILSRDLCFRYIFLVRDQQQLSLHPIVVALCRLSQFLAVGANVAVLLLHFRPDKMAEMGETFEAFPVLMKNVLGLDALLVVGAAVFSLVCLLTRVKTKEA